jgi:hypothetical protein
LLKGTIRASAHHFSQPLAWALYHCPFLGDGSSQTVLPRNGGSSCCSHDVWTGGPLPVIVTLIGWITLIRGIIVLLLPHEALLSLFKLVRFEKHFYAYVASSLILGLYLTFMGFWRSPS